MLSDQTVVVRDGRIVAVGPSASTAVPDGATRIDARDKFLLPGLAEMHGHLIAINPQAPNAAMAARLAEDVLFLYVAAGATTVRGMQGHPSQLEQRRRCESGELICPRLYLGAPPLAGMGGNAVTDPEVARQRVRDAKQAGYDLLKVHEGLSPAVYAAIADEARKQGLPWGGHVSNFVGLRAALEAKQSTVDHLDNYVEALAPNDGANIAPADLPFQADTARIPELARATKAAGVAVVPTQSLWQTLMGAHDPEVLAARPELRYMPPNMVQGWKNAAANARANANPAAVARTLELRDKILKALSDEGALILMGTDAPQQFSVPGFSLHREMELMVDAGMTPHEVLTSGTVAVGRYFANADKFGTIAAGQRADLILLDGDPLASIGNVARQSGVMVRGRWLPKAEIDRQLEEMAARR